jgi:hypothetical protein
MSGREGLPVIFHKEYFLSFVFKKPEIGILKNLKFDRKQEFFILFQTHSNPVKKLQQ